MILLVISIIIFVSLMALAVVIRDLGRELSGLEENRKGAEGAEADSKNAQEKMADRKIEKEIQQWRDGQ